MLEDGGRSRAEVKFSNWKMPSVFSQIAIGGTGQAQVSFYFIKSRGDGQQTG